MSTHSIEPGQRLQMNTGKTSAIVEVLAEAIVPSGYWLCRDEASGHRSVIARTVLFPIVTEAFVGDALAPVESAPTAA
ncbi:MAG TPA: hypothetical protein VFI31_20285 [Pirellulales bacterium]|nr:hypothetical protein [Pirellulales bacterium]